MYNLAGKMVYNGSANGTQKNINIQSLPAGMYIISLKEAGSQKPVRMKYVKL